MDKVFDDKLFDLDVREMNEIEMNMCSNKNYKTIVNLVFVGLVVFFIIFIYQRYSNYSKRLELYESGESKSFI